MDQDIFRIEQLWSLFKVYDHLGKLKHPSTEFRTEGDLQFAKDNMLISLLSSLYSVFDPSGINFSNASSRVPRQLKSQYDEIVKRWAAIKTPISRIRNNLGFHGAKKVKSTVNSTHGFQDLGEEGLKKGAIDLIGSLQAFALAYQIIKGEAVRA